MSKKEIDRIITSNWSRLEGIVQSYIAKSKLKCEDDIMSHAYEELILKRTRIKTEKQVQSYFLRIAYTSTIWHNSSYQSKNSSKEIPIEFEEWQNFEPLYEQHVDWEKEYEMIDLFLNDATLEEKLVYTLMSIGYDTSSKLSRYTKIPRTTCYLLQKKVKQKIKNYENLQS